MKDEQRDLGLMDYLDGISEELTDENTWQVGDELKQLVVDIKGLPHVKVNPQTDDTLYQFIERQNIQVEKKTKPIIKLNTLWPYLETDH